MASPGETQKTHKRGGGGHEGGRIPTGPFGAPERASAAEKKDGDEDEDEGLRPGGIMNLLTGALPKRVRREDYEKLLEEHKQCWDAHDALEEENGKLLKKLKDANVKLAAEKQANENLRQENQDLKVQNEELEVDLEEMGDSRRAIMRLAARHMPAYKRDPKFLAAEPDSEDGEERMS